MADMFDTELDQRTAMSLMSALIQHKFQQQLQQSDPYHQLQLQQLQAQADEQNRQRAMAEAARQRLLGGGASATAQPTQADNPITFGVNPRTGVASFNNLGYVGGGEDQLPANQRQIAQRYNAEAMRPEAPPIRNEQGAVIKTSTALPAQQDQGSSDMARVNQLAMDMTALKIPAELQQKLLERSFPGMFADRQANTLQNDLVKLQFSHDLGAEERKLKHDETKARIRDAEIRTQELLDRNRLPLKDVRQQLIDAYNAGTTDPTQLAEIARQGGYSYGGGTSGTTLGISNRNIPFIDNQFEPRLGSRIRMGEAQAPSGEASAPQASTPTKVVVEKDGKRFRLPVGQLEEAQKSGYKLVR